MKKIIVLMLAAILLLSLCACGAEVPEGDGTLQITAKPKTEETTANVEETTGTVEETTAAATETTAAEETKDSEQKALAMSCIDKDISELYALIGKPNSSDYASSCLVDGEDGMLYYDGFVVYTTRENGVEKVYYVE